MYLQYPIHPVHINANPTNGVLHSFNQSQILGKVGLPLESAPLSS